MSTDNIQLMYKIIYLDILTYVLVKWVEALLCEILMQIIKYSEILDHNSQTTFRVIIMKYQFK